jgi:hypothetical protein
MVVAEWHVVPLRELTEALRLAIGTAPTSLTPDALRAWQSQRSSSELTIRIDNGPRAVPIMAEKADDDDRR